MDKKPPFMKSVLVSGVFKEVLLLYPPPILDGMETVGLLIKRYNSNILHSNTGPIAPSNPYLDQFFWK